MEDPAGVRALLEEIRDLQREQLEEYRKQASASVELAQEAVARQAAAVRLYKRVVVVAGLVVLAAVVWMLLQ